MIKQLTNQYKREIKVSKVFSYIRSQSSVRVLKTTRYLIFLYSRLNIFDQSNDGIVLFVGIWQSCLELSVSINQSLYFLNGVYDEHVYKIFASSIQPVVERLILCDITLND